MGSFVAVQRFLLPQTLFSEGVACQSHKLIHGIVKQKNRVRALSDYKP
jgi:hypothetical protein